MTEPTVAFVLGTRPEIIKLAPVVAECDRRGLPYSIVHTGQHYSAELDAVFFDQLGLPRPDYDLAVGSGSHGHQTAEMLAGIEDVLREDEPDVVLVQGDTNSVLAGALATSKLPPALGHIEAGLRSFDRGMPEEVNRVVADHLSDFLFAPTDESAAVLRRENVAGHVAVTGNTIVDAVRQFGEVAVTKSDVHERLGLSAGNYFLLTAHRAENVDDRENFAALLDSVARVAREADVPVVYPVHPRAEKQLEAFDLDVPDEIRTVEPLDFLDFLRLESGAALALTDSGGVQEETCILGTPCVTLRYSTERPETVFAGANVIAGLEADDVADAAWQMLDKRPEWDVPFGDGYASGRILDVLETKLAPSDLASEEVTA